MRRLSTLVAVVILMVVAVFGATAAHGFWWWNSTVDVEGVELRSIWEVTDGGDSPYLYEGDVVITVPNEATAVLVGSASNETVTIKTSKKLGCLAEGIEVNVDGRVTALEGATGTEAKITVSADGVVVGEKSGKVGKWIKQSLVVEGSCSDADGGSGGNGNGKGKK